MGVRDWITSRLVAFLTKEVDHYEQRGWIDVGQLQRNIRKGDVLLVEGDQRVSAVIKYLTQSSWSHAALYVGDEIVRRGGIEAERAREAFGDEADDLLVEALYDGVVTAPLSKYVKFNLRLCRPHRLRPQDLRVILDEAIGSIGWRYDLRNLLDLALHLPLTTLLPGRFRLEARRLGSGAAGEVICTSLLGSLFHRVGFPVLPKVEFPEGSVTSLEAHRRPWWSRIRRSREPYSGVHRHRHPTLLTPRDFDLSPYFEIVKFNLISRGGFDYQRIEWAEDPRSNEVA